MPQGLDRRRPPRQPRAARPARWSGTRRPVSSGRPRGTRRSTWWLARLARSRACGRCGRGRGVRWRRADQREGLPARQVRPGRAGHLADRLQRALVHVVGGVGRQPGVRRGPRAAVPARRRRAHRRAGAGRLQPRRDHAARRPAPRPAPRAGRPRRGRRPAADRDRRPSRHLPAAGARHRPARSRSGVLHLLVAGGRVDEGYVAARTTGFDAVRREVAAWWPERVERVTGVAADEVRALAALLGEAEPGDGADRPRRRAAQPGHRDRAGLDQRRSRARHAGPPVRRLRLPDRTGQRAGRPRARAEGRPAAGLPDDRRPGGPRRTWRRSGEWPPRTCRARGRSAYELLDALGTVGGAKALLVFGSNIVVSAPNATHVTERLAALDLLVVCDLVMSETAALADVVLPVTQWAEETGTMTNLEGRVILRERAVDPPEGVRSDLDVIAGLAERLGSPVAVRRPIRRRSSPSSAGRRRGARPTTPASTTTRIRDEHGVFWPCPAPDHPGTPRLFADAFAHPDGRARFVPVDARGSRGAALRRLPAPPDHRPGAGAVPVRRPDPPDPASCPTPGRSWSCTRRWPTGSAPSTGRRSLVTTRRGELKAPCRVVTTIRPDTVFVPFHWVGANRLTNDALDPSSRMPEFKVCAAAVTA